MLRCVAYTHATTIKFIFSFGTKPWLSSSTSCFISVQHTYPFHIIHFHIQKYPIGWLVLSLIGIPLIKNESSVIKIENRLILQYLTIPFLTKETFSTYSFMSGAYLLILCIQVPYYKFQNTIRYQIKYNLKVIWMYTKRYTTRKIYF